MQSGGAGNRTATDLISGWPALPLEPRLPNVQDRDLPHYELHQRWPQLLLAQCYVLYGSVEQRETTEYEHVFWYQSQTWHVSLPKVDSLTLNILSYFLSEDDCRFKLNRIVQNKLGLKKLFRTFSYFKEQKLKISSASSWTAIWHVRVSSPLDPEGSCTA